MGEAHGGWPSGRPTIWLAKWEELLNQAEQYDEPLQTWLQNVCLVWEQVPDLTVYFSHVQIALEEGNTAKYTPAEISSQIHRRWEHKKQSLALKVINRPKTTRSAFPATATEPTFDSEKAPDAENSTKKGKQQRKTKKPNRGRSCSPATEDRITHDRDSENPCQACGVDNHKFKRCYLVKGIEKHWITEQARKTIRDNMKTPTFKAEVDKYRLELQQKQQQSANPNE